MSDMLQLVVEIGNTQAMILPRRTLRVPNLDDKLKHVGHLVVQFLFPTQPLPEFR